MNNRKCEKWFDIFPGGGNEKERKYEKVICDVFGWRYLVELDE